MRRVLRTGRRRVFDGGVRLSLLFSAVVTICSQAWRHRSARFARLCVGLFGVGGLGLVRLALAAGAGWTEPVVVTSFAGAAASSGTVRRARRRGSIGRRAAIERRRHGDDHRPVRGLRRIQLKANAERRRFAVHDRRGGFVAEGNLQRRSGRRSAENGSCATLKAANIPRNSDMAQPIASSEAEIATIIRRTLGNIPPRRTPSARSRKKHASHKHALLGVRSSRGRNSQSG